MIRTTSGRMKMACMAGIAALVTGCAPAKQEIQIVSTMDQKIDTAVQAGLFSDNKMATIDNSRALVALTIDTSAYQGSAYALVTIGTSGPESVLLPTTSPTMNVCSRSGLLLHIKQAPQVRRFYVISVPSGYQWIASAIDQGTRTLTFSEYNVLKDTMTDLGTVTFHGDEKSVSVSVNVTAAADNDTKSHGTAFSPPTDFDQRSPPDFEELCMYRLAGL